MSRYSLALSLFLLLVQSVDAVKVLPVLMDPINDRIRVTYDSDESISLSSAFSAEAIDDQVVRFTSQTSNGSRTLDFALFSDASPITRANFLKYVNDGDYLNSIIHRSVPGFVIQGGGFYTQANSQYLLDPIATDAPIANEFGISNTYGTISMAKLGGDPDSATSQWFVSIGANSDILDNQNGGFTVFARITQSTLADATDFGNPSEFPIWNATGALAEIPLNASFDNTSALLATDLIRFTSVTLEPINSSDAGESTTLTYSIVNNSAPSVVNAAITDGTQLQLSYTNNIAGSSTLTVRATDSVGNSVEDSFTVTVSLRSYANWQQSQFSESELADSEISGHTVDLNKDGLTNLQLYIHDLSAGARYIDPVQYSETEINSESFATFTLPIRNDLADITLTLEESTDLGLTDPWTTTSHVELSRQSNGSTDTLSLRSTSANTGPRHFYRLKFTLTE
jgi:cyclophilin family peptidyl-prolyl cis-trans isomerase